MEGRELEVGCELGNALGCRLSVGWTDGIEIGMLLGNGLGTWLGDADGVLFARRVGPALGMPEVEGNELGGTLGV